MLDGNFGARLAFTGEYICLCYCQYLKIKQLKFAVERPTVRQTKYGKELKIEDNARSAYDYCFYFIFWIMRYGQVTKNLLNQIIKKRVLREKN